jgi:hypothetical protein
MATLREMKAQYDGLREKMQEDSRKGRTRKARPHRRGIGEVGRNGRRRTEVLRKSIERRERMESLERTRTAPRAPIPAAADPHSSCEPGRAQRRQSRRRGRSGSATATNLNAEERSNLATQTGRRLFRSLIERRFGIPRSVHHHDCRRIHDSAGLLGRTPEVSRSVWWSSSSGAFVPDAFWQDIPWPTVDDTANKGELLAENTEAGSQDVTFGQVTLKAFKFSSKLVKVSRELLQDSYFPVGAILRDLFVDRIGRITNDYFTTGTGTGQPQGVVTAATCGRDGYCRPDHDDHLRRSREP